ncbi:MAG TPA: NAD(P)/FAD-dependent oxidoreductase [Rhodospirillales bacterium]|nr:NAD(P)/FAD-dependent oxidoreductase [Rhodospirillales bacterium]
MTEKSSNKLSRREFGKLTTGGIAIIGAGAGAGGLIIAPAVASAAITQTVGRAADLPAAKGRRVVVVGGGWSGLTIAKYLKVNDPKLDVVLIERRAMFMSHPMSGLWLADKINLETLTYSYLDGARHNDYIYFNAGLIDIDRTARKAYTDQGWLAYDDLVLAPGVDYDYASFGVTDPDDINKLMTRYPAGYVSGSEHLTLYNKVHDFKGGDFVLTAPPGIFRCSAAPYERACMIASVFKRDGIKGRVVLIDPREEPAVEAEGFLAAFAELYVDYIEYMPSSVIESIDVGGKTITTGFDDIEFEDAAIYPRIRGARLLEQLGLMDPKSSQKEAAMDPLTYNARTNGSNEENIYIAGDCRPMPFSKSANTAWTEGMYLAKLIAARANGKEIPWESPHTLCYSVVNTQPLEAVMVSGKYKFDSASGQWEHNENFAINQRDEEKGAKALSWGRDRLRDMFT